MKKFLFLLIILQVIFMKVGYVEAATDEFSVINVKDKLFIVVLDNNQLTTDVVVMEDGYINFPLIGAVYVKGRKVKDVEAEIAKKLGEGFLKYPVVSIRLLRGIETLKIFVYGEVQSRGELPFQDKLTILKALSLAGGMTTDGLYGKVKVRRKVKSGKDYENIEISIEAILNESHSEDILLQPGDVVIVERNKTFIIDGEVSKLGEYPLKKGMTVARALSEAGGMTKDGLYGTVKVRRKNSLGEGYENIEIDIEGVLKNLGKDILLQPDDVVIVERNKTYIVEGEVSNPAEYPLKKGMTVTRALSEAGGIKKDGLYGAVKVRRKNSLGEGYENIEIDIEGILNGNLGNDVLLQPDDVVIVERNKTYIVEGEVSKPAEYPLKKGMTVIRALSEAGGITKDGLYGTVKVRRKQKDNQVYRDIDIELGRGLENSVSWDMLLQPEDVLIVEHNDRFFVYGEVNNPGQYPLEKGLTAFTALSLAGGLTKWGSQDQIKILRRSDEGKSSLTRIKVKIEDIIKGDASADVLLLPGDILIVSSGIF